MSSHTHSLTEEDVSIPWVGRSCTKNTLSILVLSTNNEFTEKIAECLQNEYDKCDYVWRLAIHRAVSMKDLVPLALNNGGLSIDFIVVALDTSKSFSVDWAKRIILQSHNDLLLGRLVLVNATGAQLFSVSSFILNDLLELRDKYNLKLLTGNVLEYDICSDLAKRILVLLETSIGFLTGVPNVNI